MPTFRACARARVCVRGRTRTLVCVRARVCAYVCEQRWACMCVCTCHCVCSTSRGERERERERESKQRPTQCETQADDCQTENSLVTPLSSSSRLVPQLPPAPSPLLQKRVFVTALATSYSAASIQYVHCPEVSRLYCVTGEGHW